MPALEISSYAALQPQISGSSDLRIGSESLNDKCPNNNRQRCFPSSPSARLHLSSGLFAHSPSIYLHCQAICMASWRVFPANASDLAGLQEGGRQLPGGTERENQTPPVCLVRVRVFTVHGSLWSCMAQAQVHEFTRQEILSKIGSIF